MHLGPRVVVSTDCVCVCVYASASTQQPDCALNHACIHVCRSGATSKRAATSGAEKAADVLQLLQGNITRDAYRSLCEYLKFLGWERFHAGGSHPGHTLSFTPEVRTMQWGGPNSTSRSSVRAILLVGPVLSSAPRRACACLYGGSRAETLTSVNVLEIYQCPQSSNIDKFSMCLRFVSEICMLVRPSRLLVLAIFRHICSGRIWEHAIQVPYNGEFLMRPVGGNEIALIAEPLARASIALNEWIGFTSDSRLERNHPAVQKAVRRLKTRGYYVDLRRMFEHQSIAFLSLTSTAVYYLALQFSTRGVAALTVVLCQLVGFACCTML